jgi:F-type H+-transporting ATPase subunit delta
MTKRASSLTRAYAYALTESAADNATAKSVHKSLEEIKEALNQYPLLLQTFANKAIPPSERDALARDLGKHLHLHPYVTNLLRLLIRNHHVKHFNAIAAQTMPLLERTQGILRATITTAHPLPKEQLRNLSAWLEKHISFKPQITVGLDPSLLGGAVVKYGTYRLDASLRTQLHRLYVTLKGSL